VQRLRKRKEFLNVAKGRRVHTGLFSLQAIDRGDAGEPRTGFTVTKKTGHATERNRIRRRLKEAVRLAGDELGTAGHDYVLVARREAIEAPFAELCHEIARAFSRAERPQGEPGRSQARRRVH